MSPPRAPAGAVGRGRRRFGDGLEQVAEHLLGYPGVLDDRQRQDAEAGAGQAREEVAYRLRLAGAGGADEEHAARGREAHLPAHAGGALESVEEAQQLALEVRGQDEVLLVHGGDVDELAARAEDGVASAAEEFAARVGESGSEAECGLA